MMKRLLAGIALSPFALGGLALGAGLVHAHQHKLRRRTVLLPHAATSNIDSLRILHISDPHLLVTNKKRRAFIRDLALTEPDLVIITGDLISHDTAIDAIVDDLGPLLKVPGAFVFGSNDYYAPAPKNPFAYLWRNTSEPHDKTGETSSEKKSIRLDSKRLRTRLAEHGWLDLTNRRGQLEVRGWTLNFVGVDDPHIGRDRMPARDTATSGSGTASGRVINVALTHAPYTHVLDAMVDDGAHMIFAGHTHGGQVNLPIYGALVTNCDIEKRFANGMFRWPVKANDDELPIKGDGAIIGWDAAGDDGTNVDCHEERSAVVHLSAGLGTSPFVPIRTFCSPEAIQIDVVPIAGQE